jgi:hypothetical protein
MANENTKIFSEAIAEAKAIRETAMVNAKLALEEAFTPRIQEMMNNKLSSMAEDEEEMEENFTGKNGEMPGTDSMDEISLEELLAELEGLEETSGYENDPEDKDTYMSNDGYEKSSSKKGVNDPYNMEENEIFEEAEDDDTVAEITVDDLKDIIRNVVADLMGGPESEENDEGEGEPGHEEGETPEEEAGEGEKEDELSLEEILAELEEDSDMDASEMAGELQNEELEEAMSTIAQLRSELNEVNLLNSKLLYVNKLFKSKNLTEAQKVKVINAFDRAETVKESKNIYETLQESLTSTSSTSNTKSQIKESLSFASKASGVADRKPIVENNDFVARMQKLAGII